MQQYDSSVVASLIRGMPDFVLVLYAVSCLGGGVLAVLAGLWINKKQSRLAPRQRQKSDKKMIVAFVVMMILSGTGFLFSKGHEVSAFVCFAVVAFLVFYHFAVSSETFSRDEALANYNHDPQHCGQCGYNLTGNVSGICSECGWEIPKGPTLIKGNIDGREWTRWWRRWEIEHLDNWRIRLLEMCFYVIAFAGLAIGLGMSKYGLMAAILASLGGLSFVIQIVRIITYARRETQRP